MGVVSHGSSVEVQPTLGWDNGAGARVADVPPGLRLLAGAIRDLLTGAAHDMFDIMPQRNGWRGKGVQTLAGGPYEQLNGPV